LFIIRPKCVHVTHQLLNEEIIMTASRTSALPQEIIAHLCSPKHHQLMRNPVIGADGRTWDETELKEWASSRRIEAGEECYLSTETGKWVPYKAVLPDANMRQILTDLNANRPIEESKGLVCRLTGQLMKDPVVAADGGTYERDAILNLFKTSKNAVSPITQKPFQHQNVYPNLTLRNLISQVKIHIANRNSNKGDSKSEVGYSPNSTPIFVTDSREISAMTDPNFPEPFLTYIHDLCGDMFKGLRVTQDVGVLQLNVPYDFDVEPINVNDERRKIFWNIMSSMTKKYDLYMTVMDPFTGQPRGSDKPENPDVAAIVDIAVQRTPLKFHEFMFQTTNVPYACSSISGTGAQYGVTEEVEEKFPSFTSFRQAKEFVLRYAGNFRSPVKVLFTDGSLRRPFVVSSDVDTIPQDEREKDSKSIVWQPKLKEEIELYSFVKDFMRIQASESDQRDAKGRPVTRFRILFDIHALAAAWPKWCEDHPEVASHAMLSMLFDYEIYFNVEKIRSACLKTMPSNPVICMQPVNETKDSIDVSLQVLNPHEPPRIFEETSAASEKMQHFCLLLDVSGSMFPAIESILSEIGIERNQLDVALQRILIANTTGRGLTSQTDLEIDQLKKHPSTQAIFTADERFKGHLPNRAFFEVKAGKNFIKVNLSNSNRRYSIILYHHGILSEIVRSTDKEALQYLDTTKISSGATSYIPALTRAAEIFKMKESEFDEKFVLFLTDGLPNDLNTEEKMKAEIKKIFAGMQVQIDTLLLFPKELGGKGPLAESLLKTMATYAPIPGTPSICDDWTRLDNSILQMGKSKANGRPGTKSIVTFTTQLGNIYRLESICGQWCPGHLRLPKADFTANGSTYTMAVANGKPFTLNTSQLKLQMTSSESSKDLSNIMSTLEDEGIDIFDRNSISRNFAKLNTFRNNPALTEFIDKVKNGVYADLENLKKMLIDHEIDIYSGASVDKNEDFLQSLWRQASEAGSAEQVQFLQHVMDLDFLQDENELLVCHAVAPTLTQLELLGVNYKDWATIQKHSQAVNALFQAAKQSRNYEAATFLRNVIEGTYLPAAKPPADEILDAWNLGAAISRNKYRRRGKSHPKAPHPAPKASGKSSPDHDSDAKTVDINQKNIAEKRRQKDVFGAEAGITAYREGAVTLFTGGANKTVQEKKLDQMNSRAGMSIVPLVTNASQTFFHSSGDSKAADTAITNTVKAGTVVPGAKKYRRRQIEF
jgi:hypothetical protein